VITFDDQLLSTTVSFLSIKKTTGPQVKKRYWPGRKMRCRCPPVNISIV